MKPKDKAEELVLKYLRVDNNTREWFNTYIAKQCALIAVDELINTEYQTVSKLLDIIKKNKIRLVISLNKDYWQEVKNEIIKI
jgi:hypothetical protein